LTQHLQLLNVGLAPIPLTAPLFREIPLVPVPSAAVDISAANGVVGEVGQSIATSHQRAIQRLAEQIVSLMEKPW